MLGYPFVFVQVNVVKNHAFALNERRQEVKVTPVDREYPQRDPKGGELYRATTKSLETAMEVGIAVLTCKSFVRARYRGERLIEPPSSWFPPKFPSG